MQNRLFEPYYEAMLRKEYWDFRAKDYNEITSNKLEPEQEKHNLISFFLKKGIINANSRVLDLGCGPGKFTEVFAPHVKEIIGVDISENMIQYAKKNNAAYKNAYFVIMNWDKDSISTLGTFDLVFANMCPAIYDIHTLNKMNSVSHGYCYYSHFAARSNNIGDDLDMLFEIKHTFKRIPLMFSYLWEQGYRPTVHYEEKRSESKLSLQEAFIYYQKEYGCPSKKKEQMKSILQKYMTDDGMIYRKSWFQKGILFWNVNSSISFGRKIV